jgi:hypothetical protein
MKKLFLLFAIFIVGLIYFLIENSYSVEDIVVKSRYMFYACGDCYPQYNIEEVVNSKIQLSKIIGQDFDIEFEDVKIQDSFESSSRKCQFCTKYLFEGDLNYSILKRHYILNVRKYNLIINKSCYDTCMSEINEILIQY